MSHPLDGYVDLKNFSRDAKVYLSDGNCFDCKPDDDYMPNKWVIAANPCFFKQRKDMWSIHCLLCDKAAGNDHLASNQHKRNAESDPNGLQRTYAQKLEEGTIPFSNDGFYVRDKYARIVDCGPRGPTEGEHFAPGQYPFDKNPDEVRANLLNQSSIQNSTMMSSNQSGLFACGHGGGGADANTGELDLEKLQPVDCFCRPISRELYDYGEKWGGIARPYCEELFKNPHLYELFEHGGYAELRCRACPDVTKINSSHTPDGNKHKKNTQYGTPQLKLEHAQIMGINNGRMNKLPPPVPLDKLIPGKHYPVDYDKSNMGDSLADIREGNLNNGSVSAMLDQSSMLNMSMAPPVSQNQGQQQPRFQSPGNASPGSYTLVSNNSYHASSPGSTMHSDEITQNQVKKESELDQRKIALDQREMALNQREMAFEKEKQDWELDFKRRVEDFAQQSHQEISYGDTSNQNQIPDSAQATTTESSPNCQTQIELESESSDSSQGKVDGDIQTQSAWESGKKDYNENDWNFIENNDWNNNTSKASDANKQQENESMSWKNDWNSKSYKQVDNDWSTSSNKNDWSRNDASDWGQSSTNSWSSWGGKKW